MSAPQLGTRFIKDDAVTLAKILSSIRVSAATADTLVQRDANGRAQFASPDAAADVAIKGYVDAVAAGVRDFKDSVRVATAAALPAYTRVANVITADANGALADVDGVTLVATNRLLLKNGAAGADNGIYEVTTVGDGSNPFVLTRTTDADSDAEVTSGLYVVSTEGTDNADKAWILATNDPITLNTTALSFTLYSSLADLIAGTGLTKTNNTIDLDDTAVTPASYTLGAFTVDQQGRLTAASSAAFTKYSTTAAGGETTLATTANVYSKSARVSIDGVMLSEEHGDFSIVLATGVITFSTALVAGEKVEAQVLS